MGYLYRDFVGEFVLGLYCMDTFIGFLYGVFKSGFIMGILNGDFRMGVLSWA